MLGKAEGYSIDERPQELWCVVADQQRDTIGAYRGLSMPETFVYFRTDDSTVSVSFVKDINGFSKQLEKEFEVDEMETGEEYREKIEEYREEHQLPVRFEPVEVNLKRDRGEGIEVELEEQQ